MSPENQPDYDVLLEDLKAKRAKIDAAIALIEQVKAISIGADIPEIPNFTTASPPDPDKPVEIPRGAFFNMSITQAAKKYLAMTPEVARSTREVTDAIAKGGIKFKTKTPAETVYSLLSRDKDFVKPETGYWGLAEWYPANR